MRPRALLRIVTAALASLVAARGARAQVRWLAAPAMREARAGHRATLLADGRVLVTGGYGTVPPARLAVAEIRDPVTGRWSAAGRMTEPRWCHGVVQLADGRVFAVGGVPFDPQPRPAHGAGPGGLSSAEIWDPTTRQWTAVAPMPRHHGCAGAVLLADGRVLVVAQEPGFPRMAGAQPGPGPRALIYDPAHDRWADTAPSLTDSLGGPADLGAGRFAFASAVPPQLELWDAARDAWSPGGNLGANAIGLAVYPLAGGDALELIDTRDSHRRNGAPDPWVLAQWTSAGGLQVIGSLLDYRPYCAFAMLPGTRLLFVGGFYGTAGSAEIWDFATRRSRRVAGPRPRTSRHELTVLPGGRVLITGGEGPGNVPLASVDVGTVR